MLPADNNVVNPPDSHHLLAAQGWAELGDFAEAQAALHQIAPIHRGHPEVLKVQFTLHAQARQWALAYGVAESIVALEPDCAEAWIHRSNALHFQALYQEAYNLLLPGLARFPQNSPMRYNLACFCSRMGRLDEARTWLKEAFWLEGGPRLREAAVEDQDLEPLWKEIKAI